MPQGRQNHFSWIDTACDEGALKKDFYSNDAILGIPKNSLKDLALFFP